MNAKEIFYTDNFAVGKLPQEFLETLTPGQLGVVSCCLYYEAKLQEGIARGDRWVYTNSNKYANQSSSFDGLLEDGRYGVNCAMPSGWAMIDLGVLKPGDRYWGDTEGKFHNFDKHGKYIEEVCYVRYWGGAKRFCDLFDEGLVKPGDSFLAKGHTFVYLGNDLFLAAGHDGKWHSDSTAPTEDGCHAVFESWLMPREKCANNTYSVYWQFGFRDDFIPEFYRNKAGKIVLNPMRG